MDEKNWMGELRIYMDLNIKPNFSDLSRKYGVDRHRLKKCYELGKVPERKQREYESKWDRFYEEIEELFSKPGVSKIAAYNYLSQKYNELPGTYNGFRSYTRRKGIIVRKHPGVHVLYETEPGDQLQFDWKEDLKITLENGEIVEFNVFSATLGYSRMHIFIFTFSKTTEDLIRCLIETFRRLGGTPKKVLTDNMSAIVTIKGKEKKKNRKVMQLMKDLDVELQLAKVKTPQTKGKVENSNKFMNWLLPYDHKLKSVEEVINTIEVIITSQANKQVNQGTNVAPIVLFEKEKEYLKPIGNNILLETYISDFSHQIVPATLLVLYKGSKYSVPKKYINSYVDIYEVESKLYIYHKKALIAIHTISQNKINYEKDHYMEALASRIKNKEIDIEKMAEKNLENLAKLGG